MTQRKGEWQIKRPPVNRLTHRNGTPEKGQDIQQKHTRDKLNVDNENIIGQFGKYHNTLCLSPQILHKLCFVFSRDHYKFKLETISKLETMLMQNLGGQTKSIMVFSEVAYSERKPRHHEHPIGERKNDDDEKNGSDGRTREDKTEHET